MTLNEPGCEKTGFCICENKGAELKNREADQGLCFRNTDNTIPKFQALSNLVWLYSPVCVGPGRKPGRLVFSERGSNVDSFVGAIDYRKQHGGADALSPGGSVIPVHPDVTFKRLPFYDIMGELLKPTSLGKMDSFRMIKYGKPK